MLLWTLTLSPLPVSLLRTRDALPNNGGAYAHASAFGSLLRSFNSTPAVEKEAMQTYLYYCSQARLQIFVGFGSLALLDPLSMELRCPRL